MIVNSSARLPHYLLQLDPLGLNLLMVNSKIIKIISLYLFLMLIIYTKSSCSYIFTVLH